MKQIEYDDLMERFVKSIFLLEVDDEENRVFSISLYVGSKRIDFEKKINFERLLLLHCVASFLKEGQVALSPLSLVLKFRKIGLMEDEVAKLFFERAIGFSNEVMEDVLGLSSFVLDSTEIEKDKEVDYRAAKGRVIDFFDNLSTKSNKKEPCDCFFCWEHGKSGVNGEFDGFGKNDYAAIFGCLLALTLVDQLNFGPEIDDIIIERYGNELNDLGITKEAIIFCKIITTSLMTAGMIGLKDEIHKMAKKKKANP